MKKSGIFHLSGEEVTLHKMRYKYDAYGVGHGLHKNKRKYDRKRDKKVPREEW